MLAVGDEAFQRKCDNFFTEIKKNPKKTVILVTHSMESVKKYCNKAILIKDGNIVASGDKNDVADRYTLENLKPTEKHAEKEKDKRTEEYPVGLSKRVPVLCVHPVSSLTPDGTEPFVFDLEYEFNERIPFYFAVSLLDIKRGGIPVDSGSIPLKETGHHSVRCSIPLEMFNNGQFKIIA